MDMGIFGNAFKISDVNVPLTEEEVIFLNIICEKIKKKKMSEVASFIAESTFPFHNLTAQMLIFAMPFLNFIFRKEDIERLVHILGKPSALKFFKENLK